MADGRWDRLAADLMAAGIEGRLDEKPYTEMRRGRPHSGIARSITVKVPGRGLVTVSDRYWTKNPDLWLGWTVCAEGTDSITVGRPSSPIKNRGSVVNDVRSALARLGA